MAAYIFLACCKHAWRVWSCSTPRPGLIMDTCYGYAVVPFLCAREAIFRPFLRPEKRFSDKTAELPRQMSLSSTSAGKKGMGLSKNQVTL
jgi:hypothetical protein